MHKKLDAGRFEVPKPTRVDEQHVTVSDPISEVNHKGIAMASEKPRKRVH